MEVIVRNLDELHDLILVFLQCLSWRAPRMKARYPILLGCLLHANTTQAFPIGVAEAEWFAGAGGLTVLVMGLAGLVIASKRTVRD